MKKLSYLFITIISFIGISSVNADTYQATNFYNKFVSLYNYYDLYEKNINYMINYWEEHFSHDYPYYAVVINDNFNSSCSNNINNCSVSLYYGSSISSIFYSDFGGFLFNGYWVQKPGNPRYSAIVYDPSTSLYSYYNANDDDYLTPPIVYYINSMSNITSNNGLKLLTSNGLKFSANSNFDKFYISAYENQELGLSFPAYDLEDGDLYPSLVDLVGGNYQPNPMSSYVEIDLNNYSYVALSLKDYTLRNDNINQFSTNIYTKGQLCLTPVYDYGMKEKTDFYNGYQVDRCSVVYDDFTPVRTYILKQDLENNAIYYLKAYDTSIENKVKVDTNIFNITYITSENADNPSVNINGRNYPTIAYNNLSSSSTQSEEEGYVSGESTNVLDRFDDNFISNFFSSPLNVLKSVWGAITSMLSLVATFIALLPSTLQGFLYMSFALAIILGIIKILL